MKQRNTPPDTDKNTGLARAGPLPFLNQDRIQILEGAQGPP
jgi:hypothetical protein